MRQNNHPRPTGWSKAKRAIQEEEAGQHELIKYSMLRHLGLHSTFCMRKGLQLPLPLLQRPHCSSTFPRSGACMHALHACIACVHCVHCMRACVHCMSALHACIACVHSMRALHACIACARAHARVRVRACARAWYRSKPSAQSPSPSMVQQSGFR